MKVLGFFFSFNSNLLFSIFIWTFVFLFNLDFYFPFLIRLFVNSFHSFFYIPFYHIAVWFWISSIIFFLIYSLWNFETFEILLALSFKQKSTHCQKSWRSRRQLCLQDSFPFCCLLWFEWCCWLYAWRTTARSQNWVPQKSENN